MKKFIYFFNEIYNEGKEIFGGKGVNLVEMICLGLLIL